MSWIICIKVMLFLLHMHVTVKLTSAQSDPAFNLPTSVNISENSPPGSLVFGFVVVTNDSNPQVWIQRVDPPTTVFASPILRPGSMADTYQVEIRLSSNASLDFEMTPAYFLTILVDANNQSVAQTIVVQVLNVNEPPNCDSVFENPGATVSVPEDLPAPLQIYFIRASDPDSGDTLKYTITEVQPPSANVRFTIFDKTLTSTQGFDYQNGQKSFIVAITVSDQHGASCNGSVSILVLPVLDRPLNFTNPNQSVSITEEGGPNVFVAEVTAVGSNVFYEFVDNPRAYQIDRVTGIIRTSYNLDLDVDDSLKLTILKIRAFIPNAHRSGTAVVCVLVLDVNDIPPVCVPPNVMLQIPETTPINKDLVTFQCKDPDISNTTVTFTLQPNADSLFSFRLAGGQLIVNNTLDYDNALIAANNFQYTTTIIASDNGIPPLTTEIQVIVVVTPVNEGNPQFLPPFFFNVREDTVPGAGVGIVKATDPDWEFNAIGFSITSGNEFFIDPMTGELYLRTKLDYETQRTILLNVQAVDLNQDIEPDPAKQRKSNQEITINVMNVNDNPPVCDPTMSEFSIYSTLKSDKSIVSFSCTDADGNGLTATIITGSATNRFSILGMALYSKNAFSYNPDGVFDPTTFEILVQVSDGKYSTTVVVIVHVVPWVTTAPTTTTPKPTKSSQVVTLLETYWEPEVWYVVVLTVTGALILIGLGLLILKILQWCSVCRPPVQEMTQLLIQKTSVDFRDNAQKPAADVQEGPATPSDFDGKARDPVTGKYYLFNSQTGQRRWN
ncbi:cadherin-related family member 4-like [Polypterus senegalus]|uniref:cadherin-related family member 4-like n=1 Tax=Polypterus senegalus TaxID=55291 RepID=UPI001962FE67|nr:cadherin-related family member 4-like [Polypterus senegalus]